MSLSPARGNEFFVDLYNVRFNMNTFVCTSLRMILKLNRSEYKRIVVQKTRKIMQRFIENKYGECKQRIKRIVERKAREHSLDTKEL